MQKPNTKQFPFHSDPVGRLRPLPFTDKEPALWAECLLRALQLTWDRTRTYSTFTVILLLFPNEKPGWGDGSSRSPIRCSGVSVEKEPGRALSSESQLPVGLQDTICPPHSREGSRELSVLSLQLFYKCEVILEWKVYFKMAHNGGTHTCDPST